LEKIASVAENFFASYFGNAMVAVNEKFFEKNFCI